MIHKDNSELQQLSDSCQALQKKCRTVLLSTAGKTGPEISYAPYISDDVGNFYIFISELAAHTKNLIRQPQASLMFIEDEGNSQNLFARERVIYQCQAVEVAMAEDDYNIILQQFEQDFGNIIAMLRSLPDFHLFRLQPLKGSYVVGFGKAYEVDPATGGLTHISEEVVRQRQDQ